MKKAMGVVLLAALMVGTVGGDALARGRGHFGHHGHHRHHGHHVSRAWAAAGAVVLGLAALDAVAGPRVVYQQPVYYAPPPVYYTPPPVYYTPPPAVTYTPPVVYSPSVVYYPQPTCYYPPTVRVGAYSCVRWPRRPVRPVYRCGWRW